MYTHNIKANYTIGSNDIDIFLFLKNIEFLFLTRQLQS